MAINIKSKSARAALKPRRNPYFHCLRVGLYVGYRRVLEGEGTWIARRQVEGTKRYVFRSFGPLLSFDEAAKLTEEWAGAVAHGVSPKAVTVGAVCKTYVTHLASQKGKASAADADGRFRRLVYDESIGAVALDRLRTTHMREWLSGQVGEVADEAELRRSKDSANRNLSALKAALNLAWRDRLVQTDAGWRSVTAFQNVGQRRQRYLSEEERAALLVHCDEHLSALVRILLLTAVRPGEIARARVGDFDPGQGTLYLYGKTGGRPVTLSTAASTFLKERVKDAPLDTLIFVDQYGNKWNKDSWKVGFREAVSAAKLTGQVVMYTLRHTAISDMIVGGVDSFIVARLAGTSTAMIDRHYGHLKHQGVRAVLDRVAMTCRP